MDDDGMLFELFNANGERMAHVKREGGRLVLSPLAQALVLVREGESVTGRMNASTDSDDPYRIEAILMEYGIEQGYTLASALPDTDDSPPGEQLVY